MVTISLSVRNILAIVGTASLFVLFLTNREERWTNHGSVRTATTTDTSLYETPPPPVSSSAGAKTTQTKPVTKTTSPTKPQTTKPPPLSVVAKTPTKNPPDNRPWPKLSELISGDGKSIKADVQFVLDFAIIGHPKCATTASMFWLADHPDVQMHRYELHALQTGQPAELVRIMYELEPGFRYKRGYKAPRDITSAKALLAFAKYFPATKLMIGLRHPVLWFQSFYNFRIRGGYSMPPAETLMGAVQKRWNGVSTDESRFHVNLDHLGKTKRTPAEMALLGGGKRLDLPRAKNLVFLYELNQLHDANVTRSNQHLVDLQRYLGLPHPLAPFYEKKEEHDKSQPGIINICDAKYRPIRAELMKNAINASRWIREYFMESPDVSVSSPEYFRSLVEEWMKDPCDSI